MKKYISLLLCTIFIFNALCLSLCYADTNYTTVATTTLNKMGIIIGDENGDLLLDKNLTRAEFATIIVRLIGKENDETPTTTLIFDDVEKTFWGYSSIYKCVNEGYLIGDGDGSFRPEDIIKYEEVLTIMIRILNKENGLTNWPDDHIKKAEELKIAKNVDISKGDNISRSNACIIIYNCLNINI